MEEKELRSGKYTWRIESFNKRSELKFYYETFTVGGCKWRVVIYPTGNGRGSPDHLSMHLEVADAATLPDGCGLSEYVNAAGTLHLGEGSEPDTQRSELASDTRSPSVNDIEKAKHSLKECLSDLFKLNMTDRLASALSILSHAQAGLSPDQQRSIETFKANFGEFVCEFLSFDQENSDFELQKILTDQIRSSMKKNHETYLAYKRSFDSLAKEEEEHSKRLKEVSSKKMKLMSDWETLMNESEVMKSKYAVQKKKLAEAEEKRKIAEKRTFRSISAWSSLKEQFL
ncbi:hypothetical protein CDL15_Pgr015868 [Punica granatum]|uniref:MATH domain-containing protein n=1 Tax=Punica granatum TaxID=22663 RepID=A0A218XRE4_PUNGR|nr:hypothetical protein CDL15_Pgr015868 [Punica granatum]